uniref:Uncharacterized protein n=1 Tax=viral metagenome TaxID=1070528 RepID=A0A6M3KX85_9ZZZZ
MRYKVLINWSGEVHKLYTHSNCEGKALLNAIRQLAKRLGREVKGVRDYVMDSGHRRWEVTK